MRVPQVIGKFVLGLLLLASPFPARADDISDAERSVVRVVVVLYNDSGDPVGLGHGSGFAVAANRIVTNAHVVQATDYRNTSLFVVAENSKDGTKARVIYKDPSKDLALLQIDGSLPPLSVFGGEIADGVNVFALGYPGNVDLATANSISDYIAPKDPVRSQGNFSNRRTISGIDSVLHTAAIARGNSGGPLLDECGRVIGVNSFTTNSGDGDSSFGFAISNRELRRFLKSAGQVVTPVTSRCLSPAERLTAEQAETAKERERAELARRAEEQMDRAAREKAAAVAQRTTEDWVAVAIIFALLGLISLGAGGLLFAKDRTRPASRLSAIGIVLAMIGAGIFFARPTPSDVDVATSEPEQNPATNFATSEQEAENAAVANEIEETEVAASESASTAPPASTFNLDENLLTESLGDDHVRPSARDAEEVDYNEGL